MNISRPGFASRRRTTGAFTLVEVMICVLLGAMVLAVILYLTMFAARSFAALTNYQILDDQSRNTMDTVCRDLREATAVTAETTNGPVHSLTLTNSLLGIGYYLAWNTNAQTFTYQNTALGSNTYLAGCDQWNFALFQRTPIITATNITYYPATNNTGQMTLSLCKLVDMSWHAYATILGAKVNTESVQTAQIVLRN